MRNITILTTVVFALISEVLDIWWPAFFTFTFNTYEFICVYIKEMSHLNISSYN